MVYDQNFSLDKSISAFNLFGLNFEVSPEIPLILYGF
jgi:hypothetical protein